MQIDSAHNLHKTLSLCVSSSSSSASSYSSTVVGIMCVSVRHSASENACCSNNNNNCLSASPFTGGAWVERVLWFWTGNESTGLRQQADRQTDKRIYHIYVYTYWRWWLFDSIHALSKLVFALDVLHRWEEVAYANVCCHPFFAALNSPCWAWWRQNRFWWVQATLLGMVMVATAIATPFWY